jgi:hypothetical protein
MSKEQNLTPQKAYSNEEKTYRFWNGKNIDGESFVGKDDLIPANRNTATLAKYDVSNETVSINNLQNEPQSTNKTE